MNSYETYYRLFNTVEGIFKFVDDCFRTIFGVRRVPYQLSHNHCTYETYNLYFQSWDMQSQIKLTWFSFVVCTIFIGKYFAFVTLNKLTYPVVEVKCRVT